MGGLTPVPVDGTLQSIELKLTERSTSADLVQSSFTFASVSREVPQPICVNWIGKKPEIALTLSQPEWLRDSHSHQVNGQNLFNEPEIEGAPPVTGR